MNEKNPHTPARVWGLEIEVKICFVCGKKKNLDEFYTNPLTKDGVLGKCKECSKADSTARRYAKIEEVRAYDRERNKLSYRIGRNSVGNAKWQAAHPDRRRAHVLVRRAIIDGRLFIESCVVCGNWKTHAHHDDYTKPLMVRWLCAEHHSLWHATEDAKENQ